MKHEHYIDRSLVLILWELTEDGRHDVKMFPGTLVQQADHYYLDLGEGSNTPVIPEDWLDLVVAVPPELKSFMRYCDYQLSLTAGDVLAKGQGWERFGSA